VSRPLLAWSTKPVARFMRVFYALRASSASSIFLLAKIISLYLEKK
jgi:hypothetical protein